MFFDLSSMQPEDITRAVDSAKDYINNKMAPADLVASVSLVSGLSMDQDFTSRQSRAAAAPSASTTAREGTGFAGGQRRRRHRRHLGRLLELRRRRQRVQRAQYRPPALRHPHRLQVDREGRAEEEHALLLRRPFAPGHREPGQHPLRHQRVRQGQHRALCGRYARPAGAALR